MTKTSICDCIDFVCAQLDNVCLDLKRVETLSGEPLPENFRDSACYPGQSCAFNLGRAESIAFRSRTSILFLIEELRKCSPGSARLTGPPTTSEQEGAKP